VLQAAGQARLPGVADRESQETFGRPCPYIIQKNVLHSGSKGRTAFRLSGLYRGYGDTDRESQASCRQPLAAALSLHQAKKIALHIIYCYHGNSSMGATAFFNERRFEKVYSMTGGYTQWQSELRAK